MYVSMSYNPRRAATQDDLEKLDSYMRRRLMTNVRWYVLSIEHVMQGDKAHLQCCFETSTTVGNISTAIRKHMEWAGKPESLIKEWKTRAEYDGAKFLQGYCLKEVMIGEPPLPDMNLIRTTLTTEEMVEAYLFYMRQNEADQRTHHTGVHNFYEMFESYLVDNIRDVWSPYTLTYVRDIDILHQPREKPLSSWQQMVNNFLVENGGAAVPRFGIGNLQLVYPALCLTALTKWCEGPGARDQSIGMIARKGRQHLGCPGPGCRICYVLHKR
jgi:hypothetical protein